MFSPLAILVLAALLRVTLSLAMGQRYWFGDTAEYAEMARSLRHGTGVPLDSPRAPLFPALMAIGMWIGGDSNWIAIRLLNQLPALALIVVVMRLGRRLGGATAERIAGLLTAFLPMQVFTSAVLYPTSMLALCLAGLVLVALQLNERATLGRGALLGVVVTAGWLTDQVFAVGAAVTLLWLLGQLRSRAAPLVAALATALLVLVALSAPYLHWRAGAFGGDAVFLSKAQYVQFFGRSDPSVNQQRWLKLPPDSAFAPRPIRDYLAREVDLVRNRPLDYLHDYAYEGVHFYQPFPDRLQTRNAVTSRGALWLAALAFLPVLVFQWIGLFAGRGAWRERLLLALVPLAVACFYGVFFTQTRYRVPVEPMMIVLSALGLQRLFPRASAVLLGTPIETP